MKKPAGPEPTDKISDFQIRCLTALASLPLGRGLAEDVAARLGYRPARSGRLAVTSALRGLMKKYDYRLSRFGHESGTYVSRFAPATQWNSANWAVTSEARALIHCLPLLSPDVLKSTAAARRAPAKAPRTGSRP